MTVKMVKEDSVQGHAGFLGLYYMATSHLFPIYILFPSHLPFPVPPNMPPKRPPPLPRSLFTGQGPLAPGTSSRNLSHIVHRPLHAHAPTGSAPLPPSPTRIHPDYIVDSHSFVTSFEHTPDPIYHGLAEVYPRPPVRNAVQVKMKISAEPAQAIL